MSSFEVITIDFEATLTFSRSTVVGKIMRNTSTVSLKLKSQSSLTLAMSPFICFRPRQIRQVEAHRRCSSRSSVLPPIPRDTTNES